MDRQCKDRLVSSAIVSRVANYSNHVATDSYHLDRNVTGNQKNLLFAFRPSDSGPRAAARMATAFAGLFGTRPEGRTPRSPTPSLVGAKVLIGCSAGLVPSAQSYERADIILTEPSPFEPQPAGVRADRPRAPTDPT